MRFFIDTEFIEDGKTIDLISIGVVAENGEKLYLENYDCDLSRANEFVKENVIPHLENHIWCRADRRSIRSKLIEFCGAKPEFWGYYADYDWVVVCQLFGNMTDLPANWPRFCMDIKQLAVEKGNPDLHAACDFPDQTEHNALEDAKWNYRAWLYLTSK